jgi:carboxymethylenebutenolidase
VKLEADWISYPAEGARLRAYRARSAAARESLPAVIVIQEIWGVDEHIQDMTQRFARAGYLAVAPDLFSRDSAVSAATTPERIQGFKAFLNQQPPSVWTDPTARQQALDALPAGQRELIAETMRVLLSPDRPIAQYVADLRAASQYAAADPGCSGTVGCVGYCLGGMLSALLAGAERGISGAVVYYGSSPDMAAVADLACPVLGLYGELDTRITSTVPAFAEAMAEAGKSFEHHIYPDAPHAFFNDTRPSYRIGAARDAWARTLSFFSRTLAA